MPSFIRLKGTVSVSYSSNSNTSKATSLNIPDGYSIFSVTVYGNFGWGFAYLGNIDHDSKSISVAVKNFGTGSGTVTPAYEVILINQNM